MYAKLTHKRWTDVKILTEA